MNKSRIILLVTGGVIALAVLTLAFFAWCAFSDRTAAFEGDDENEGLETVVGQMSGLLSKKPYPSVANKKRIDANAQALEDWYVSVRRAAAQGDWRADSECTTAQFKETIVRGAKAVSALKGADGKPFVSPEFTFGPFKDYLADTMPTKEQLARLQRQWYDFQSFVRLLSTNGVVRLTDFQSVVQKEEPKAEAKGKVKSKVKGKEKDEDVRQQPSVETYRLAFQAKPAAMLDVVRVLSFQDRFTVAESLSFARARDAIGEALGGEEKKESAAAAGGRRGRRRAVADEKKPEEEKKSGGSVVFDPERDATLNVTLTVSVYDFRSLEDDEKGEAK